jgi:hypothetical protein
MPNAGRPVTTANVAFGVLAFHVVEENVLRNDDVAFHSHHFGDVGDLARTVAQARGLNYDVNRGAYHFADSTRRQGKAAHRYHRL